MRTKSQEAMRLLVRVRRDFQKMRISVDNRLGIKASGEKQKVEQREFSERDTANFLRISIEARKQEKEIEKMLKEILSEFPIYNDWLKDITGISHNMSAVLLSDFDIQEATTVSKMWQYAGLNPGVVRGKKRVPKEDYKEEIGEIVGEVEKDGKLVAYIVLTDDMIRADKATPGYILPYNKDLRKHLLGILADSFIKKQSPYSQVYYNLHIPKERRTKGEPQGRLDASEKITNEVKKGGQIVQIPWKETTEQHRHQAAKRKMIKEFLKDLYAEWREKEGLPVRVPYEEEYLGKEPKKAAIG